MWNDLTLGFKTAFETAWDGYKAGSKPIGAAIVDTANVVVASGRNQCNDDGTGLIARHQLAHAEANAILRISEMAMPDRYLHLGDYTLYSTLEPCPFCFGAIVMGSIRHLAFGARDRLAGAAILNKAMGYIEDQNISIDGPFYEPEIVQIALLVCYEIETVADPKTLARMLGSWNRDCAVGVEIGRLLAAEAILPAAIAADEPMSAIFDDIINIAATFK